MEKETNYFITFSYFGISFDVLIAFNAAKNNNDKVLFLPFPFAHQPHF